MGDVEAARHAQEVISFDGLSIAFDARILRPRPWTLLQSTWAAELLPGLPAGPVLELCCGAGHIGLAAARRTSRGLVCVDRDPVATSYAVANARAAGLADRVEVRQTPLDEALGASEDFALVIADPPWVPTDDTGRWPQDPLGAIDGGPEGLNVARLCLEVAAQHLMPGGVVLLQLGGLPQVDELRGCAAGHGLLLGEVRTGEGGVVALFRPDRRQTGLQTTSQLSPQRRL
jgi:methylase of polypeptide subunit release factors